MICAALLIILVEPPAFATGFDHVLKPGRYKIDVIVENPHTGRQQTVTSVERCIDAAAITNHKVFEMLSDTPASKCVKYEICAGETRTGFMAQCTPSSATSAIGMFALEPDNFRGRIEVKDGADQITNIELQYADRLGDCNFPATEE